MVQISSAIGGAWLKGRRTISASSSLVIQTRPIAGFTSLDYVITGKKADKSVTRSLYYRVLLENAALKSTIHGKMGTLKMKVDEAIVSSNIELTITNDEIFDIEIEFARLVLG